MSLRSWLNKHASGGPPRAERRPVPGLAAFHKSGKDGSEMSRDGIKDISASGVYLLTSERWQPGELIPLTLQKLGPLEMGAENQATVFAKAVRWGKDGVALSFILPRDIDFDLWQSPLNSVADQPEPEEILREFRMAEALAFLNRICPLSTREMAQFFRNGLGDSRVENAVEIALKAGRMLGAVPGAYRMKAPPQMVLQILENGSWADDDRARQLWAGLLSTTCTNEGEDESNLIFVGPLSQLTSNHVRILSAACTRATKVVSESGSITAEPLICPMEEVVVITGTRDIAKIDRDIAHLYLVGLLEKGNRSLALLPIDQANITPTSLGLELFARCSGHRGTPRDFYDVAPGGADVLADQQPGIAPDETTNSGG